MAAPARILLVDDDASIRKVLSAALRRNGYLTDGAADGEKALAELRRAQRNAEEDSYDVVISDLRMPNLDGNALLATITKEFPQLPVVMLTAHGTVDDAVFALKSGAFDFVSKPFERDELLRIVAKASAQSRLDRSESRVETKSARVLLGASTAMQGIVDMIDKVASSPSTVLVRGESGTGKELVAVALHEGSKRADKPFIRINCGAIPPTLIEAELFGYEKGAFTGAVAQKPGRFELADGGTLFLDEVGDLPLEMQVRLLRVLQEGTFERVGGVTTLSVDVRLVAATNQNLDEALAQGRFREDLYYRLNVVPILLPPLRERQDDIAALADHFRQKFNQRLDKSIEGLEDDAIVVLKQYHWPGNIRELENIVERSVLFTESRTISANDLPPELIAHVRGTTKMMKSETDGRSMKEIVKEVTADVERDLIADALVETNGNVTRAAQYLKISRKSLQLKMRDSDFETPSQRPDRQSHESKNQVHVHTPRATGPGGHHSHDAARSCSISGHRRPRSTCD